MGCGDEAIAAERVKESSEQEVPLAQVIPEDERAAVLQEAAELDANQAPEADATNEDADGLNVKLTSYEGSKGLSAQHVFLVGLHAGDLPRNRDAIQDIEICRFLVGLTRTKKKCTVLLTRNFAGTFKDPSPFLEWVNAARFEKIEVNAAYWKK